MDNEIVITIYDYVTIKPPTHDDDITAIWCTLIMSEYRLVRYNQDPVKITKDEAQRIRQWIFSSGLVTLIGTHRVDGVEHRFIVHAQPSRDLRSYAFDIAIVYSDIVTFNDILRIVRFQL